MKTSFKRLSLLIAVSLSIFTLSFTLSAQNLAEWNFDGDVNTPSFVAANSTAQNATFGPGIGNLQFYGGNGGGDAYSGNSWSLGALNADEYIEFTVAPASNYVLNLTEFGFDERRSGTGPHDLEIRTSLDGFVAVIDNFTIPDNTSWRSHTLLPLDIVGLDQSVTFRIYGFNAEGSSGTWRFDNVYFVGTAEIPSIPLNNWAIFLAMGVMVVVAAISVRRRFF